MDRELAKRINPKLTWNG